MTMKSGAGDDPFADESSSDDESTEEAVESDTATNASTGDEIDQTETPEATAQTGAQKGESTEEPEIPRIMARSSVKENRDSVLQFFVTEDTAQQEDAFERAVAEELDIRTKDLMKLDLREAAYLVAMQHPEETAEILNDWGYEYR